MERNVSSTAFKTLRLAFDGEIALLTLDRPEKRNAISMEMVDEFPRALDEVETSPARALIITGAGTAFSGGLDLDDLKAISKKSAEENLEDARRTARFLLRIWNFAKPSIAAVNGPAIAGGTGIATLSDFTLAVPEAKFGYTEVRIGFIPALVSIFLIRQIGEKRASDLLLSGRVFDAEEAHALGLVNEVVPPARLLDRARELATTLAALSPASLVATKRLLRKSYAEEMGRQVELAIEESARSRSTADFREGITAFLEKRKPVWRGE